MIYCLNNWFQKGKQQIEIIVLISCQTDSHNSHISLNLKFILVNFQFLYKLFLSNNILIEDKKKI